jgi:hypothetical protein
MLRFMRTVKTNRVRSLYVIGVCVLALSTLSFAQDPQDQGQPPDQAPPPAASQGQPGQGGGWQHFSNPPQDQSQSPAPVVDAPPQQQGNYPPPQGNYPPPQGQGNYPPPQGNYPSPQGQGNYPQQQGNYPQQGNSAQGNYPPPPPVPAQLTLRSGAFITVRVNQFLSSDRNQPGDAFTATLSQPLVVDSVVVAEPGETVGGRVVEAKKAGMVKGVSRLALQLTSLTLINGQPIPIQTALSGRNGPTSNGRDAAAIAGTTGLGAAVGASVARPWDVGNGAAIGAGAGAAVGILGVLLTRGRPTDVYPEQMLTFETAAPVAINTTQGAEAFHYVGPDDYPQQGGPGNRQGPPQRPCYGYGCPPPAPYYYGYGAGYPYWGPGVGFYWGPRFYGGYWGRAYWGRGFYGRGFYGRR